MSGITDLECIQGTIERITYYNEETGFGVIKVVAGNDKEHCVVGGMPSLNVGEFVIVRGKWVINREYGRQLQIHYVKSIPPNTKEGMEKYLGSGLVKGIGPHFARKLVERFAEKVPQVIEETPEKLNEISGIGKIRIEKITKGWHQQKIVREIMIFLQSHKVGTSKAFKIYKTYGNDAIKVVTDNPYQLAKDIRGIGFLSADTLARSLGIPDYSDIRIKACLSHVLMSATSEGHCGMYTSDLIRETLKHLSFEPDREHLVIAALEEETHNGHVIKDELEGKEVTFHGAFYNYEKQIADLLMKLTSPAYQKHIIPHNEILSAVKQTAQNINITPASKQREAITAALSEKVTIITGGPGTGKTTIVNIIVKIFKQRNLRIKLCAPTGRAARRMSESTEHEATTLHNLLHFRGGAGFIHNADNPVECDVIIIDEASMIDVPLAYHLLKALPLHTSLIIIGDINQLPSVGPGRVLQDIIDSGRVTTITLETIFRQDNTGIITTVAHAVNKGSVPPALLRHDKTTQKDFYFIEAATDENIINTITKLISDRIPKKFNIDPVKDIQILSPMQRSNTGTRALNALLQKLLNPQALETGINQYGSLFAVGDKVMQTENNYDDDVYNGDIGYIEKINKEDKELTVKFDTGNVVYDFNETDCLMLSYAVTIHKSQGSEYPVVIIPITMKHYTMLKRNLIYTGITRGKKLVIMIGEKKAFGIAVKKPDGVKRISKLCDRLRTTS